MPGGTRGRRVPCEPRDMLSALFRTRFGKTRESSRAGGGRHARLGLEALGGGFSHAACYLTRPAELYQVRPALKGPQNKWKTNRLRYTHKESINVDV